MTEIKDPVKEAAEYVRRPNSSAGDEVLSAFNGLAKWIALTCGALLLFLIAISVLASILSVVFWGNSDAGPWIGVGLTLYSIPIFLGIGIFLFIRKLRRSPKARKGQ